MTLRKWKTVAVATIGLTLFASIPAFAGGGQQGSGGVWLGGPGGNSGPVVPVRPGIGRQNVSNPLSNPGAPGTPMGNGGTGPQNPGQTGTPTSGGPFTPGQNGAPTGPFGPGTIAGQPKSTGPFNSGSQGGSSGNLFSKLGQAMGAFFSVMMTVNMFRWAFGWMRGWFPKSTPGAAQAAMVNQMPANSVMPVAATTGSTGIGANAPRNAPTQAGMPGTPITQRLTVDGPMRVVRGGTMLDSAAGANSEGFNHHVDRPQGGFLQR